MAYRVVDLSTGTCILSGYCWRNERRELYYWLSFQFTAENEESYIYTRSRQCGGHFATQKVPVKQIIGLKILKPFNFTGE